MVALPQLYRAVGLCNSKPAHEMCSDVHVFSDRLNVSLRGVSWKSYVCSYVSFYS